MGNIKIPHQQLEEVIDSWKERDQTIVRSMAMKVRAATNLVYSLARKKRGMINVIGGERFEKDTNRYLGGDSLWSYNKSNLKKTAKMFHRTGKVRTISDPSAEWGVPVRTGALRALIVKEVEEGKYKTRGVVRASGPYSNFIEYGTRKMRARPFMRPAIDLNRDRIHQMFIQRIKR